MNGFRKSGNSRNIIPVMNRFSVYCCVVVSHSSLRPCSGPRKMRAVICEMMRAMIGVMSTLPHVPVTMC